MSDYLVIVESPTKAKTIGKFLGKKYQVMASVGHLRDLPKSRIAVDIEHDFTPQYTNIRGKADLIKELKKKAAAANKVFLATDPDREGEAISWHLAYLLGIDEQSECRVSVNEITQNAVKEAIKHPRKIDMELVDAYQARRILDRVVGYKISPILWKKVKKGLSAGRVQSVVTRLICDREEEIEAFVPKEYWSLEAVLQKQEEKLLKKNEFTAKFYGTKSKKMALNNKEEADKILAAIEGKVFQVLSVKESDKRRAPAAPFTTSTMQQEASRKIGFPTSKTMLIAQQLFEGVDLGRTGGLTGLVTYIRTDSTRISDEAAGKAREFISKLYGEDYLPKSRRIYKNRNSSQDAHEAIRPVNIDLKPEEIKTKLTSDQYKLYKLIYDRFIASQMADAVLSVCSVDIEAGEYLFRASGSAVKFDGFTKLYEESRDEKSEDPQGKLPKLAENELLIKKALKPEQHFTQPPARYTEGSLVKTMEEYGIGRPSTYATIVSTVQARGYVGKEKKTLYPTELGRIVNGLMKQSFRDIVDVEFTAHMEEELDEIEQGQVKWTNVLKEFYKGFAPELEKAEKEMEKIVIADPVSDVPCEKCGRMMVYKTGKFGKFLACPGFPECRNTKAIIEEVGTPCPECGKMLIFRKTKTGKRYVSCSGYPDCKFNSWNIPTGAKCPKCGSYMEKPMNRGGNTVVCSNKECKYTVKEAPGK